MVEEVGGGAPKELISMRYASMPVAHFHVAFPPHTIALSACPRMVATLLPRHHYRVAACQLCASFLCRQRSNRPGRKRRGRATRGWLHTVSLFQLFNNCNQLKIYARNVFANVAAWIVGVGEKERTGVEINLPHFLRPFCCANGNL